MSFALPNLVFVLLSGGIDSLLCLHMASRTGFGIDATRAVMINYGQRHGRELNAAVDICRWFKLPLTQQREFDLSRTLGSLGGSPLTDQQLDVPKAAYDDLPPGMSPAFVPGRNLMMIAATNAYAQASLALGQHARIYYGANADDAARDAYPDCKPAFIAMMNDALQIASLDKITLSAPLARMTKTDIVKACHDYDLPLWLTWSCYLGGAKHCGECPTCRARKAAFIEAAVKDPTEYAA